MQRGTGRLSLRLFPPKWGCCSFAVFSLFVMILSGEIGSSLSEQLSSCESSQSLLLFESLVTTGWRMFSSIAVSLSYKRVSSFFFVSGVLYLFGVDVVSVPFDLICFFTYLFLAYETKTQEQIVFRSVDTKYCAKLCEETFFFWIYCCFALLFLLCVIFSALPMQTTGLMKKINGKFNMYFFSIVNLLLLHNVARGTQKYNNNVICPCYFNCNNRPTKPPHKPRAPKKILPVTASDSSLSNNSHYRIISC